MKQRATVYFCIALLLSMIPTLGFALQPYSQDFEGLTQSDTGALTADGWLVFGNVFGLDGSYWYGYGVFPAPNDGGGFCQIALDQGGPSQGLNTLAAFSDYNNADHGNGGVIEANVFQEQVIGPDDVGEVWVFNFDAKRGNIEGASTAKAFIKTLNPAAGYAMTNFITEEMTTIPDSWNTYSIGITIDASLVGQLLQIGFTNNATAYEGSGIFYDNLVFFADVVVSTEEMSFDGVKSLYR
jgi:hypothetical protein